MANCDPEDGTYPLSKAQEGIWFLWNLDPNSPNYAGQGSIRIKGELDLEALSHAWRALFDRHEITRARFEEVDGQPRQRFLPASDAALTPTDLTHLAEAERHGILKSDSAERAGKAFNLATDALLDYRLYKFTADEHVIAIAFHEIIIDPRGLTVLINDLGDLYGHFLRQDTTPPPAPKFRFSDYVQWEQAAVTQDKMRRESDYWCEQLSGELPVLSLPTDRSHPAIPSYRGAAKGVLLSAEVSRKLNDLARTHDATLFTTLLSAITTLLHVYSGQDDIIVGAPIANRHHPQSEDLVGFFLNMVPLRTRMPDDPSFAFILKEMRETVGGALLHANYPFSWMLELADVVRDLSVQPVFQVVFNMLDRPQTSGESGGIQLSYDEIDTSHTKYDLAFGAQEQGERVHFQIAYLTDLFDDATIQRMLDNFVVLLESITEAPEAPLSRLRYLTDRERGMLLDDLNDTSRPYPTDISIHQMFERQAAATPGDTAIIFDGTHLSYRALNDRANRLARYLRRRGVAPEARVAICIPRSVEMVVGLLAILKAGGAYVALDTEYPDMRLTEILHDSAAEFLLVSRDSDRFDGFQGVKVSVDGDWATIGAKSGDDLTPMRRPDELMNIVYTSSTTGKPKGVLIEERSVLNRLQWMWEAYPFQPGDVALLQKSYALVASTWEIFGALLKGHPTVILRYEELLDPVRLWQRATEHKVTHLLATPALLEGVLLQAKEKPGDWRSLRLATTSAEQIPVSMVARWKQSFPDVPLLNLYGATECSSNATVYDTSIIAEDAARVPVGKPIGNVRVYVLDKRGNPLPFGASGEMCVSGACVARGYLNNDELSRRQFVANRFSDLPGDVLYRTGDLARFRSDGNLELVGRRDNQVTIRGFRVELNDVEAVISRHDDVAKAAVVPAGSGGRKRLVAYVASSGSVTPGALRAHLIKRLPGYMVPAEFVFVEDVPITPQGKLDRKALSAMAAQTAARAEHYVSPRTETERRLAAIWTRLLEVEEIGVHDDFFDLGGQSLLAIQLFAVLRQEFATDMPLATLYQSPTIAALAENLNADGAATQWSSLVAIRSEGSKPPLFCVHGVYGDVLFYREFAKNTDPEQPIYCLQPMTLNGKALQYQGVEELAAHYVELVRQVQPTGPYYICGYSFGGMAALDMAQQLRGEGEAVAFLGIFDTVIGSRWADPVQHAEDLGHTRSAAGVLGKLRRTLRESYAIWYAYMALKGVWLGLQGRLCDLYARRGHILPRERRSSYTAWILRRIGKRYRPRPYDGDVVLFCSEKRRHKVIDTWSAIVGGNLAISDVPGDHLFIFETENAKKVAEEFNLQITSRAYSLAAE